MKESDNDNMLRDAMRLLGKYFLRLSEYCFAGVLLAELVNTGDRNNAALRFGFVITPCMALLGVVMYCLSYKLK